MLEKPVSGFLNINKPSGMTSHDVVAQIRRGLKIKKVGHAGTLDPLATGVLVLCLGSATRLSEYAMKSTKRYRARVWLGVTTDTYDAEGSIQAEHETEHITGENVKNALANFTGEIDQIPPMYSAIKQGGRKLYQLARAGETVERKARRITISAIDMVDWSPPYFTLDVTCSAGTYIRSLAHDLGEILGVGAHLAALTRTASGVFNLENAVSLAAVLENDDWQKYILPPDVTLSHWPALHLSVEDADHIRHGRAIPDLEAIDETLTRAYDADGRFIAILKGVDKHWKPHKVFLVHG